VSKDKTRKEKMPKPPSISFAVTAFQEMSAGRLHGQRITDSIRAAMDHPAVDEVVIVDDASDDYNQLCDQVFHYPPTGLFRLATNPSNLGVFGNKIEAIAQCTGDWVITSDSDNVMDKTFIDKIVSLNKRPDTWYCPSFARTHFDYRTLVGGFDLAGIGRILHEPMFQCACNTGNQTVHRESFMHIFGKYRGQRADLMYPNWLNLTPEQRPMKYWRLVFDALDSFILNFTWLLTNNRIHIAEGLEYDHYWSGGPESNYARSPKEKDDLGAILFKELEAASLAAQNR